jgi:multiple sugar transport system permease protein
MSHALVTCLIAVAANLVGMLVIYSAMSHALARLAWHGRGTFTVIGLVVLAQLFWIVPAVTVAGHRGDGSYVLWFGNWLVCGFGVNLFWKSTTRIPLALDDAARVDGLGTFGRYRHTVFPFVRRDLATVAILTVMATLLTFWSSINLPYENEVFTMSESATRFGEPIGRMVAMSLVGALPLVAIFFAMKRRQ